MRLSSLLLLLLALPTLVSAQSSRDRVATVAVVESNDPLAHVYADSTWLGPASRSEFTLPEGTVLVRVVPNTVGAWGDASFRVQTVGLDTVRVVAHFPYRYRLEATPLAAEVFHVTDDGWTLLGTTPAVLSFDEPLVGTISFQRTGFAAVEIQPGAALWNRHNAVMRPVVGTGELPAGVRLDVPGRSRKWIDYAAVGTAVVGGILAVHYKTKADNRFDVYRENGDPTLRPAIDRFDRRSAFALGGMQAGVGVFALRLVLNR